LATSSSRAAEGLPASGGGSPDRSASLPLTNVAPGAHERDQVRALTIRQRRCADSISVNVMASAAAFRASAYTG